VFSTLLALGGGVTLRGGFCSGRTDGCNGWQPSCNRGKCASIASAQTFRRRHTTPKNTMSASKEGSRVGKLRVGVKCRLIPGLPFVPAIIHRKNLAVTLKKHEYKGKQSLLFQSFIVILLQGSRILKELTQV
jgi:hypothetical protein